MPRLVEAWSGQSPGAEGSPSLLSAGSHALAPAASAVTASKQMVFWFPAVPAPPPVPRKEAAPVGLKTPGGL